MLQKLNTELKNLTSHTITLSRGTIFAKKTLILCKKKIKKETKRNANISKIKMTLVLKCIFSETTYVC